MLPSLLTFAEVRMPHPLTLLILTNLSGGPVPGMWAGFCLFVSLMLEFGLFCPRFLGLVCFEMC